MRLIFAGTPAAALPSLEALLASRHPVIAVVTRPDAPAGRGRRRTANPVATRAHEAGLEVLTPDRPSEPAFLARLAALAPDCCPVVGYGALLPPAALAVPPAGWVNLHFSLLPAWRGAAPVQHAILAGDEVTGASTFHLEAGLDTGPVFGVVTEEIRRTDTAGSLLARLAEAGAGLLVATLDGIAAGSLHPVPQAAAGVSVAPKLTPFDVRVEWSAPGLRVERLTRAATPDPGPWTAFRGGRLGLGPVRLADAGDTEDAGDTGAGDEPLPPGQVRLVRRGVLVGTGSTPVRLGEVRPEGRRSMPADAWARGARPGRAERFT